MKQSNLRNVMTYTLDGKTIGVLVGKNGAIELWADRDTQIFRVLPNDKSMFNLDDTAKTEIIARFVLALYELLITTTNEVNNGKDN